MTPPSPGRLAFGACVAAAFALMLAPVAMVMVVSVFRQEIVSFPPSGFTLQWYVNAWERQEFARGFLSSQRAERMAQWYMGPPGRTRSLLRLRAAR